MGPNSASVLGLKGLLSKSREGFVVLDGPINQLQVTAADVAPASPPCCSQLAPVLVFLRSPLPIALMFNG